MAKTSNTAQSVVLVCVLVILVVFGACYLLLIPQLISAKRDLVAAQSKSAGLIQDQQSLESAKQQLTSAEQALNQKGVDFSALSAIYPPNEDMPDLYIQLDSLMAQAAASEGVTSTYTVANPVLNADQTAKVPITFTATGSYASLLSFFALLQTNIRPILISQISFAQATVASGTAATGSGDTTPASSSDSSQLTASITAYTLAASLSSAFATATTQ